MRKVFGDAVGWNRSSAAPSQCTVKRNNSSANAFSPLVTTTATINKGKQRTDIWGVAHRVNAASKRASLFEFHGILEAAGMLTHQCQTLLGAEAQEGARQRPQLGRGEGGHIEPRWELDLCPPHQDEVRINPGD